MLSDLELVYLWRQFSEEHYCASWMLVEPGTLKQFKNWLDGRGIDGGGRSLEDYEMEGLPAIREVYQSRSGEVADNVGLASS